MQKGPMLVFPYSMLETDELRLDVFMKIALGEGPTMV